MAATILERLKKTIEQMKLFESQVKIEEITPETRIWNVDEPGKTIGFDALDFISWEMDIQEEFNIKQERGVTIFGDEDIETIGDIIRILEKYI